MRKSTLSLALIGTLALTGCGRNPVAPQGAAPTDPMASSARGTQSEDPISPDVVGEGGANGALHVESGEAGTLKVGRWSLTIHKNSHVDAATIALIVRDPNSMEVEIEVTPSSANHFQVPIELVADCSDQPNMVMSDNAIFWWNEGWEQAPDLTVQEGSMFLKAKTSKLASAMIGPKSTAVTTRGANKRK